GDVSQRMRCETALIKSIFRPKLMVKILEEDPYILMMALVSPSLLFHSFRMHHLDKGIEIWINKDQNVAKIFILLEKLTRKIAVNQILIDQLAMITESSHAFLDVLNDCPQRYLSYKPAKDLLTMYLERAGTNKQLTDNGYMDINDQLYSQMEKIYVSRLKKEWSDLSLWEKSCSTWRLKKFSPSSEMLLRATAVGDTEKSLSTSVSACFSKAQSHLRERRDSLIMRVNDCRSFVVRKIVNTLLRAVHKCYSDIFYLVNVCLVFTMLIGMVKSLSEMVESHKMHKMLVAQHKHLEEQSVIRHLYFMLCDSKGERPTRTEFLERIEQIRPDLLKTAHEIVDITDSVTTQ
nr:P3 protein [Telosma mosaic virus]